VAAFELAFAEARSRSNSKVPDEAPPIGRIARPVVRRSPGVVLLRCAYDIRAVFVGTGVSRPAPIKRDLALAITAGSGAGDPEIFELDDAVFDLLAALDDWAEQRIFDDTPEAKALVADLRAHYLLELSW
jgi:hypothetical protein